MILQIEQKFKNRIKEMPENKQTREYFNTQVNPIFEPLLLNLIKYRPQDLLDYCIRWFKQNKKTYDSDSDNSDDDDELYDDINDEDFRNWRLRRIVQTTRKKRIGVCCEVYGLSHNRTPISLRNSGPKNQKIQMQILFFFSNSFLFSHFSEQEKKLLIQNMIERQVLEGQRVIVQGQYGQQMSFVVEGQFQCYHESPNQTKRVQKIYKSGDIFGELCILQNSARSMTIQAQSDGIIYCLDRSIYRHIKKLSIVKKRSIYTEAMNKINIFDNFQKDDLDRICDVLTQVTYEPGKSVIIQGDTGNKFYIVLQGVLVAQQGNNQSVTQCFKEGDYFGQYALLNDVPRQATVKTVTKCVLVYLSQDVFKRIVNKQRVQKQIAQKYKARRNVLLKKRGE